MVEMKKLLTIMFASLLLSCSSESFTVRPATSYNDMIYIVSGHITPGMTTQDRIMALRSGAIGRAVDFCINKGRHMLLIEVIEDDGPTIEAKFMCLVNR
jgi:hypothetical protein